MLNTCILPSPFNGGCMQMMLEAGADVRNTIPTRAARFGLWVFFILHSLVVSLNIADGAGE